MAGSAGDDEPGEELPVDPALLEAASGLYSEPFFLATVSWRLVACRRALRPMGLALLEVVDGLPDGPVVPSDPAAVASAVRATLRSADIGARMSDGAYGILLEDTPEDGAVWALERLRRSLGAAPGTLAVRAGVACYPGQALTAADIVQAARTALSLARDWPQDRIEVAPAGS